ncbi:uracil-DNA glycosylase family protein [Mycobacteroides abscessus]|uniref:uracil-DNA glycosylase family protein n=1 Tax=Mycobacteroides abscessus TaxID=36809 RepID=UPI000927DB44|nr:uracil-DNA glycosylase family protein [Mycobacteroides abscessus]SIG32353.1 glycosylase [Mycobacteroides abscessus subsp. abscessus]SIG44196.1 glycosylase [Mycobacteroides abscessus subsp. abscessus]SIM97671.1 glycosylase [Mycobacteroides abscessus subsp. abscessus]SIN10629.1 glycosylase [Mycobacteroides abscessus subsp. abscessus]SIN15127.1 glycosylase [Mycobacteroides abscessus subsp. abscessus]
MSSNAAQDDTTAALRRLKITLDTEIANCRRCDGMNIPGVTASAPGYGCLTSPVALVGQSLCEKCMQTRIPFTEGSGELIDEAISLAGLKKKRDVFISNAVHCHPPKNRPSHQHEIVNCSPFLHRELEIVRPRLVITLGRDAERVMRFFYPRARVAEPPFEAPRGRLPKGVPLVFAAKHPSWIQRQHDDVLEDEYVSGLAAAIRWSFDRAREDSKG